MSDKKMMGWVCIYDDWSGEPLKVADSSQMKFEDLPDDGIQGFMKYFADGTRQVTTGYDYYFYVVHPNGMSLLSGNNHEDNDIRYPNCIIKRGKHTTDQWTHSTDDILFSYPKVLNCKDYISNNEIME